MASRRILILFAAFLLALVAVEVRLVQLQIVNGAEYASYAERQRIALLPQDVARARILTSDGKCLAEDTLVFDLAVVIGQLDPEQKIRAPLRGLFSVPRAEKLHHISDVRWEVRLEGSRTFVGAASKIEIEVGGRGGAARMQVADREVVLPLPPDVVDAVRGLAAMTGVRYEVLLDKVIGTLIDVARMRTPVFEPVPVVKGVAYETVAAVETQADRFRGFAINTRFERTMPSGPLAAHLVGYVARFNEADVDAAAAEYAGWPGRAYFLERRIGRSGIEKTMDKVLRGEFGMKCVERDNMNREQQTLADAPPRAGRDVVLTIDSRLQKITEDALRGKVGAAVLVDVSTGAILAIASSPTYDPGRLSQDYTLLDADPDKPFFNRAVSGRFPPGSVFKIISALAALEKNGSPASVTCAGSARFGNRILHCHGPHGTVDLVQAITVSCNVYFGSLAQSVGGRALIDMARRFGLDERTAVQIPEEAAGMVVRRRPDANGVLQDVPLAPGDVLNLVIGQGDVVVTPLEAARMMAAVANDGVLVPPRIVRELRPFDADALVAQMLPDDREPAALGISRGSLDAIRRGLYSVVNEPGGTSYGAFRRFNRPFKVCGKTGTAQRKSERNAAVTDNVGWLAGYAPHEKPRVAFAIVVERLTEIEGGGNTAGVVAARIFEKMPLDLLGLAEAR